MFSTETLKKVGMWAGVLAAPYVLLLWFSAQWAAIAGWVGAAVGLLALFKPLPAVGLGNRFAALGLMCFYFVATIHGQAIVDRLNKELRPAEYKAEMRSREAEREARVAKENAEMMRRARMETRRHPETHLSLKDLSWTKEAADTIMMLSVTVVNPLDFAVKDIEVHCDHYANSGTRIDSNQRTIFEIVPARGRRRFENFNMGFIRSQAVRTRCSVVGATPAS